MYFRSQDVIYSVTHPQINLTQSMSDIIQVMQVCDLSRDLSDDIIHLYMHVRVRFIYNFEKHPSKCSS